MSKWQISLFLSILTIIFISACTNSNLTQSQGGSSSSPAQTNQVTSTMTIPDNASLSVVEVVDVEAQFIAAYQAGQLADMTDGDLDVANIKVKFQSWSPDGEQMLLRVRTGEVLRGRYETDPPGWGPMIVSVYDLWLGDAMGRPIKQLTKNVTGYAWSPDNQSITYIQRSLKNGIFSNSLWLIHIDDNIPQQLATNVLEVSWLDEDSIIFQDMLHTVNLINREGNNTTLLTAQSAEKTYSEFSISKLSPNRQHLAFSECCPFQIIITDKAYNHFQQSAKVESSDASQLFWSPDSEKIAFYLQCSAQRRYMNDPACNEITVVRKNGEKVRTILNYHPDGDIIWHPNSEQLLFMANKNLYLTNLEDNQLTRLADFSNQTENQLHNGQWSPKQNIIAFNQNATGNATFLILR